MRLFTAIRISEEACDHLAKVIAHLSAADWEISGAVRWIKPENLHVTLKFLGEIDEAALPELIGLLAPISVAPMRLFADHVAAFPKRGRAHVIVASLSGDTDLLAGLFGQVESVCEHAGIAPRDRRLFVPHITLGRSTDGARISLLQKMMPGPQFFAGQFELIRSTLAGPAPTYSTLRAFGSGA